eukprot:gene13680-16112_t
MTDKMIDMKKKEADAAMKEGDKLWRPDWDGALMAYEKAGKVLLQETVKFAAAMAKEMKDVKEEAALLVEASKLYRTNGNSYAAADAMTKAAKILEDTDLEQALSLLHDSCELFELDDKEHYSGDTFKMTISMLLKHKKYFETIELLMIQNRVFTKLDNTHDLHKSCLSVIVVHLALDDVVSARKKYDDFLQYASFIHSQEGSTGAELINAYESNNTEAVKKICSRHLFNFLDNQVAKIAKNLTVNDNAAGTTASGILPYSLTSLRLGDTFSQSLEHVLPLGLEELTFGRDYSHPLFPGWLPMGIKSLTFGNYFNQPLIQGLLPSALTTLTFGWIFNSPLVSLPSGITTLTFGVNFNQPIAPGQLPAGITTLTFGESFNQPLLPNVLPVELKTLIFGDHFNYPFNNGVLPNRVETIIFGKCFNRIQKAGDLPATVRHLKFGQCFRQQLSKLWIPEALVSLTMESGYMHPIPLYRLPSSLTSLTFQVVQGGKIHQLN